MPFRLSLFAILLNQVGSIGFGTDRYFRKMDENGEGGEGGGGTETEAEKTARLAKEAADKKALDEQEFSKLPEWAQKQIKDLRKESGDHRTKNKNLADRMEKIEKGLKLLNGEDDDQTPPEEKVKQLAQGNEALSVDNTILSLALDNGVYKEHMKYFKFLINEKLDALGEDEELSEEAVAEIAEEAKGKSAPVVKPKANSSTSSNQGGKGKVPATEITAEQFKKMGMTDKSKLYRENPELYNKLFNEVGI